MYTSYSFLRVHGAGSTSWCGAGCENSTAPLPSMLRLLHRPISLYPLRASQLLYLSIHFLKRLTHEVF